jgi:type IV secretory pathway VirB10-like protein
MKRAVHAFFWFSVVVAIAAVITRQGKKPQPVPAVEVSAPKVALDPKPALEPVRPALPPDGRLDAAAPDPSTATPAPAASAPRTEADFMRQIRDNVRANPELALALAKAARQELGDSAESDERDKLLVDALINLQKIGAARDETGYYYRHHPAGQYRQYLWAMTGARPDPPAGPANGSSSR